MNRAEQRIERIVFVEARGHADVGAAALAERMQRHVDAPAPVVEAEPLGHGAQERALLLHREAAKDVGPRLDGRGHDLAHERHQALLQFARTAARSPPRSCPDRAGRSGSRRARRHSRDRRPPAAPARDASAGRAHSRRNPTLALHVRPRVEGLAAVPRLFAHELGRQLDDAVVVAAGMLEDDLLVGGELLPAALQRGQQLPDARVAGGGVLHLGHERRVARRAGRRCRAAG